MVDRELVRRKLNKLIQYLKELEAAEEYTFADYLDNYFIKRTVERLLQLIVETATDINSHIAVDDGKKAANDYYESFILLSELDVFDRKFAYKIAPSTGLRNRIVHEYEEIDDQIVYNSIDDTLKMYKKYIEFIENYIEKETVSDNGASVISGRLQKLPDIKTSLGEGPVWNQKHNRLIFVDITGQKIYLYYPVTQKKRIVEIDEPVGAAVPRQKGGLVLALKNGFALLELNTEELNYKVKVEEDLPENRFNDGKCDPEGRFWAGTMSTEKTKEAGNLYCLEPNFTVKKMIKGVTVSNGLAWSPDGTSMYYIDSPTQQVLAYDYELKTGNIYNKRVVVEIPENSGVPDGMTIDEQGMLWVAQWGGYQVSRWNPTSGKLLEQISIPAAHVSSCTFGGDNLDELFITTAREGLSEEELESQPQAGCIFKIKTKVKGCQTNWFAG